jgi:hypothetical protein
LGSERIGEEWEKTYPALAAELAQTINPNILGNDAALLIKLKIFSQLSRVSIGSIS